MSLEPYPQDISFDIECYPNIFTAYFQHIESETEWCFEISERKNQSVELHAFLTHCKQHGMRLVGYNNVGYDYPIIHEFVQVFAAQGSVLAHQLRQKSDKIIGGDDRWGNIIWPDRRFLPQLDLYMVHHFDNAAKSTSLKALEVNMRSHSVQDLPLDPNQPVPLDMIDALISYNRHDVLETAKFYKYSLPAIKLRQDLTDSLGMDFTNHSLTKIGKDIIISELEKVQPGSCFEYSTGRKKPRQTPRPHGIPLGEVIFPYVKFKHPEFQRVLEYLRGVTITDTKSAPELENCHAIINGFQFDFGTGGIHGSIEKRIVWSDDTHVVIDADVASFYPNLAIKNRVYPAHLSEKFCDAYEGIYITRQKYPKKTAENLAYKEALNASYGNSNNAYSPLLDPFYTMTITVNGQLLLCMCVEELIEHCDAEVIQCNTDGFTVRIPRDKRGKYDQICADWQELTKLTLEFVDYDGMWIDHVNSYLARTVDGKVKRVGAYQVHTPVEGITHERQWHQDHSALVVPKAVEAVMLRGESLEGFIRNHTDPFDFMLRVKVPRSSRLVLHDTPFPVAIKKDKVVTGYKGAVPHQEVAQNTSRYYIPTDGKRMTKIMPGNKPAPPHAPGVVNLNPLNERRIGIEASHTVALCNVATDFDWSRLDYSYYIDEARKLLLTPGDLFARVH